MAANRLRLSSLKLLPRCNIYNDCTIRKSRYCTKNSENEEQTISDKSGFAKFDEKQKTLMNDAESPTKPPEQPSESFASLLKNSNFIAMGNPVGKQIVGEIYHVVDSDLYIDFGWKFPTVCTAPEKNKDLYVVGAKVKLLVKDLELCTKFLGGDREITLREADCILLGLLKPPARTRKSFEERRFDMESN